MMAVSSDELRQLMMELYDDHSPGGVHTVFRTVHALFYWFEDEYEPEEWANPIRKLHAPRVDLELLDPVSFDTVRALLDILPANIIGTRDRAILLTLFHTGLRASELLALDRPDVDLTTRTITVRRSKGRQPRSVYLKKSSKGAIKTYLSMRTDKHVALFLNFDGERLAYDGLRGMVRYRSLQAEIEPPMLHAFRRAFALNCIRAGMDILTLQRLMGHRSILATQRYVKHSDDDLKLAADEVPDDI